MLDAFQYYARCNTQVSLIMFDIIKKNPNSFLFKTGGFYDSIASILDHIYISNLNWIKAFLEVIDSKMIDDIKNIPIPEYGSKVFDNIEDAELKISKTFKMTEEICSELKENDIFKIMVRKRRNGEVVEKIVWKALIHFFNHQTHHRGQISEILDELNILYDYSNMIFID